MQRRPLEFLVQEGNSSVQKDLMITMQRQLGARYYHVVVQGLHPDLVLKHLKRYMCCSVDQSILGLDW